MAGPHPSRFLRFSPNLKILFDFSKKNLPKILGQTRIFSKKKIDLKFFLGQTRRNPLTVWRIQKGILALEVAGSNRFCRSRNFVRETSLKISPFRPLWNRGVSKN